MNPDDVTRFPLTWPTGWARTPAHLRQRARFHQTRVVVSADGGHFRNKEALSVGDALERLTTELRRLNVSRVVVSSNLRTRQDGRPYAAQARNLDDPGVAVYFHVKGAARVLACDKWISAAENIAAIAGHIEAIRAQQRYGVGSLDQVFAGYAALPPQASHDWRLILGFAAAAAVTRAMVDERFRERARAAHPDTGGSHDVMARLSEARAAAIRELT
jgi:hypothetical protein